KRQEWFRYKKLGDAWRKPRGVHSKLRRSLKYRIKKVKIGFRGPRLSRGLHPSGFKEVLVHNTADLQKVDPAVECARISRTVGNRKKEAILNRADELGIKILNRGGM
ncbi:MAG TPA: 50S ribosomal protein L32e, partial [Euryarchaeota archaeon]|nr:50S ribosomal protein L32e [Euryarchaeota archaeon]